MSAGFRRLRINTQERAMSPDINRLQTFMQQEQAEFFRHMLNMFPQSGDDQLGIVTAPNTIETPVRAEVINGLLVKPQAGSLDLLIDPGLVYVMAPDAAPDESNYKYIRDPGVLLAGSLQMTANASGQIRIDVIECAIDPNDAVVTDSRDIFNASTGLFAAATVTKELRGQLQYRVRAGTPGAGMPANQQGWLPLCVASVPNGAVSTNTMTFWDVRPLIGDRANGPIPTNSDQPITPHATGLITAAAGPLVTLTGTGRATTGGRRVGGKFRRGTPGTDADTIVLTDTANQEPTFAVTNGNASYLYLLTPFGLPRWARYTDGPVGRLPRSPMGIPVLSNVAPNNNNGAPGAAVSLPTITGLLGSTTSGVCIVAGMMNGGNVMAASHLGGSQTHLQAFPTINGASINAALYKFTLTPGTNFPKHARFIRVVISLTQTVAANNYLDFVPSIEVYNGLYAGGGPRCWSSPMIRHPLANPTGGSLGLSWSSIPFWIPVPQLFPSAATAFDVTFNTGTVTVGPFIQIVGWDTNG